MGFSYQNMTKYGNLQNHQYLQNFSTDFKVWYLYA